MLILPFFLSSVREFLYVISPTLLATLNRVFFSGKKNEHVLAVARQMAEAQRA